MKRTLILLSLCFLPTLRGYSSPWDVEYWQFFRGQVYQRGPHGFYLSGEYRMNQDITRPYYYRFTGNFSYQIIQQMDLEAHYSFIYSKPLGNTHFSITHRLEIEANTNRTFSNGLSFRWRNRFEFDKAQGIGKIKSVMRNRATLTFPIKNRGSWIAAGFSDEFFYGITEERITENRFVPLLTTFQFTQNVFLEPFVMIRTLFKLTGWENSFVIGSNLNF